MESSSASTNGRAFAVTLLPPLALIALGMVPGVNFVLYSAHGGIGWLLLYMALPYVLLTLLVRVRRSAKVARRRTAMSAVVAGILYVAAAFPLSYVAAHRIQAAIGLDAWEDCGMYRIAIFPLGLIGQHAA